MNKNQKIFKIVLIVFTLIVIAFALNMCSQTTAPWNKKKQAVRAWS